MPEFQPHVATSKNPAPIKDPSSNSRKIQPYQPSKLISSCGLITKEQDYQPYQLGGKLLSMTVCSTPDKDPRNSTHYYCNHCNKEKYDYPERHRKWNKELCLTCGKPLPKECNWINMPSREGMCNATCQYMILICDWVKGRTPFEAAFNRALRRLQHYPHDKDELYNTIQTKEISIQYYDNGHLGIVPERAHPTNARFDLQYLKDQSTTLPPKNITKINLKIMVKIPPGIMVQIALQSSFTKKGISIQGGVINSGYTGNLMVLLQNNSEKPYTIESKEKIAQAIFLSLVKIGKFVLVENHKELIQTTRRIFEELIYISENTIMRYLGTELENVSTPQEILNFPKIALYCELTSINWQQPLECYQFMPEKLAKLNIGTMDLDQQQQLKALILKYSDIFSRNGKFGRTNLVQHQIPTEDTRPEKQCVYCVPPIEHNFIREEV
ncbi:hypothetical protein G9A89_023316 [Geosiphon pyriformis]|nr:hypothetical protein G9A89_023316 [Geosiphon pyriformis]